jgi:hypothetical protein
MWLIVLAALSFERGVIDPSPPASPYIKVAGDFNGDGKLDVAIGGAKGPLAWYANPGWRKSQIAAGGYESVDGEAGDIDRDGDLDLVIGGVLWYENPFPQRREWKAHRIAMHRTHDVEIGDLDLDGKLDVVVRGQTGFGHKEGHRILIFRQHSPDNWAGRAVACPEGEGLKLADLDRDGDPDIAIAGTWFENTQDGWSAHVYSKSWTLGDSKVETGDIDGDKRADIVLTPAEYKGGFHRMSWFRAPEDPRSGAWEEHVFEQRVENVVHGLAVADMNGDGRPDIATAQMHQGEAPQQVRVYLNGGGGTSWRKRVVSERGSHNILAVDLNGDGAMDLVGANHAGPYAPVEWWRGKR